MTGTRTTGIATTRAGNSRTSTDFWIVIREAAEQLRKNPSLADNQQFLKEHPELQAYLQQHPAVQQELKNNPNAFMQEESRFDRNDSDRDREAI